MLLYRIFLSFLVLTLTSGIALAQIAPAKEIETGSAIDVFHCGNSLIETEAGEECDDGDLNGTSDCTCGSGCKFTPASAPSTTTPN